MALALKRKTDEEKPERDDGRDIINAKKNPKKNWKTRKLEH
jgi:hypothetical protein